MLVTLDGRRLAHAFSPEYSLQALVDQVRREHLGARIVIEVTLDGRPLVDPALAQRLLEPIGSVEQIDLASGDARELVAAALRETADQLDLAAGAHIEIAGDIQAGRAADAIRQYSELLPLWHACRTSVQNAGAILGMDFADFRHAGRTLTQWFQDLAARLRDVRDAFEARDYVMLSDALKYEMPQVCQSWNALLGSLADYVGAGPDERAPAMARLRDCAN